MASYVLRQIDDRLWRQFKGRAASQGFFLKDIFRQLIQDYADGKVKPSRAPEPERKRA